MSVVGEAVARPARIIDAHVHLWDPVQTDWYPYLSGGRELNMGDVSGMSRRFDATVHAQESTGWNVVALVNVAAATGPHSIDETLALDERAATDGQPAAIIGGLPPTASTAEAVELLDRQGAAGRFRGVRPMGRFEDPVPPDPVLEVLAARGLIFELMAHPHQLVAAAERLAAHPDLIVAVEHAGWPRDDSAEERERWQRGLEALASLGARVVCKVSGLAMPLGSMRPEVFGPWVRFAIDTFGPSRCCVASNFPVDGMHGTLDELFTAYATIVSEFGEAARDDLFAGTAERVYRPICR